MLIVSRLTWFASAPTWAVSTYEPAGKESVATVVVMSCGVSWVARLRVIHISGPDESLPLDGVPQVMSPPASTPFWNLPASQLSPALAAVKQLQGWLSGVPSRNGDCPIEHPCGSW